MNLEWDGDLRLIIGGWNLFRTNVFRPKHNHTTMHRGLGR